MKILLTGRDGQVGWELERVLPAAGEVIAAGRAALDLSDLDAVRRIVRETKPDVIVNAAAYTAVDKAETEPQAAMRVNGEAPGVMAEEARKLGALLVHYSTDYVFDGHKGGPYKEDDAPNPLSAYGRSKLEGERRVLASGGRALVLRTSWVYAPRGKNFFLTIVRKARAGEALRVVSDQIGVPNTAAYVAHCTARLLAKKSDSGSELLHLSAGGVASWHQFAEEIVRQVAPEVAVAPIPTREYPLPARRPAYGVLDSSRLAAETGEPPPDWRELLAPAVDALRRGAPQ